MAWLRLRLRKRAGWVRKGKQKVGAWMALRGRSQLAENGSIFTTTTEQNERVSFLRFPSLSHPIQPAQRKLAKYSQHQIPICIWINFCKDSRSRSPIWIEIAIWIWMHPMDFFPSLPQIFRILQTLCDLVCCYKFWMLLANGQATIFANFSKLSRWKKWMRMGVHF